MKIIIKKYLFFKIQAIHIKCIETKWVIYLFLKILKKNNRNWKSSRIKSPKLNKLYL